MTYNFGREGVSYEMKDGKPTYTDLITDTTKNGGLSTSQAMSKYIRACYNGPFVQDARLYHADVYYAAAAGSNADLGKHPDRKIYDAAGDHDRGRKQRIYRYHDGY